MKNKFLKTSALLMVAVMAAASLAGCGQEKAPAASSEAAGTNQEASAPAEEAPAEFTYPMEGNPTITYWMELNGNVAANYSSMEDTAFGKNLQAATGVDIEYEHPAVGQTAEQFNLKLAGATLPDIMEYSWLGYSGGPAAAIDDEVIIPLNDVIDQYMPNFKAWLAANPEIDKMIKTDEGVYYCVPFIRGGDTLLTSMGLMLRGDWLEELGLEVPTTIAEWEEVLTAFKEKKGATAPFSYQYASGGLTNNNPFAYAYGVCRQFYIGDDGKVHYGAIEEGYKEYLMTMNKWMEAGLIDVDLATLTGDQVAAKVTSGAAGASFGYCGSALGTWTNAGKSSNEAFTLVAAPYPTTVEGATPEMGQMDNNYIGTGSAAITTSCENVEAAARLLDYAFSEAGNMLYNFGEEGASYTMVDGKAVYTEDILANPNLSIAHAMSGYIRANYNGPFVQSEEYAAQYYQLDTQKEALKLWSSTNMAKHRIPPTTPTVDESSEQAQILGEITTYRDEMTLKFILGDLSFDEWDNYVAQIEKMGIDRVLEIQNAALDRYNSR